MVEECMEWLGEARNVFPNLDKKVILAEYKRLGRKSLGCVKAKIEQKIAFNPEDLLLGRSNEMKKVRVKPKEFMILINQDLQKIKNPALRKEVVQSILMHELLHIEQEDLITLSKDYSRRRKKKVHVNEFEEEVFNRYNRLRELKGIMQIEKKEHLDMAIQRILESIDWWKK